MGHLKILSEITNLTKHSQFQLRELKQILCQGWVDNIRFSQ